MAREGFGDPHRDEDDEEREPLNARDRAMARDLIARARLVKEPYEALRRRPYEVRNGTPQFGVEPRVNFDLTPRERDVLKCYSVGLEGRSTAEVLGIGEESVKTHLKNARTKLAAKNVTMAVAKAIRAGLIP